MFLWVMNVNGDVSLHAPSCPDLQNRSPLKLYVDVMPGTQRSLAALPALQHLPGAKIPLSVISLTVSTELTRPSMWVHTGFSATQWKCFFYA